MGWDPERPAVAWSHPLPSPTRAVEKLGLRMGEAPAWCHPCPLHAKRGLEGQEGSFRAPTHLQTARTQPVFGEESSKVLLATGLASTAVSIIRYLRAHRLKGPALFLLCRQCPPHPPQANVPGPRWHWVELSRPWRPWPQALEGAQASQAVTFTSVSQLVPR